MKIKRNAFRVNKIKIVVEPLEKFTDSIDHRIKNALLKGIETRTLEISVSSYDNISKILTPERVKIIHTIRSAKPKSISYLAAILGRDRRAVATDLGILETYGIVEIEESRDNGKIISIPHTARALEIVV